VNKVGLDKSTVDYICAGTVIQFSLSNFFMHTSISDPDSIGEWIRNPDPDPGEQK
jgi:hypothetical protein